MAGEPPLNPPRYGAAALADLAPSVLASLGVPGEVNTLGLPPARRACVLLVDGMGAHVLRENRDSAPFLASLIEEDSAPAPAGTVDSSPVSSAAVQFPPALTAGFPATTATNLTSLGTGCAPGCHGILGYQVAVPDTDRLLNQLRWNLDVDPHTWQPRGTVFQRARAAGLAASYVAPGAFEHGSFTAASARGSTYWPANDISELVVQADAAVRSADRSYTFLYHSDLDSLGHMFGVGSAYWRAQLGFVDRLAEQVAQAIPADTALYITADHGMVDVSPEGRVDVETPSEFTSGVRVLGGEPRMRHVYTWPDATEDVHAAWTELLDGRALVLRRQEVIDHGWFGDTVPPEHRRRIGDLLAVTVGDTALVAPASEPVEAQLVGMHGSLTPTEVWVPLLRSGAAR
ncbi:alkaline phosphatase family protein [Lipingzhangella rawalii]|uniref:alkaline phosphatase family protein n=1 Tax=Lipingzhangella rawalii TaxID=2055835 RepID=UPI0038996AF0